ncbi:PhoX family protein [Lignipirellula cremea]|uniref:Phosphatase n=1 Tax=Lignipirellula cremea TaxID=2528010 RepID=A0A518E513_9BACT|nr:PhoX family phosphatase [Lignipirellula cremea]QDU99182.1 hypothetical protein Pla8534_70950 [Lignipirellula cremea]
MTAGSSETPPPISELIERRFNRRSLLRGALSAGVLATTGCYAAPASGPVAAAAGPVAKPAAGKPAPVPNPAAPISGFQELPHTRTDGSGADPATHHLPYGFRTQVVMQWGDRLFPKAPAFDAAAQTPASQLQQFGYNNDFVAFLPLPRGSQNSDHGLLVVNHEYTNVELMFPGLGEDRTAMTPEQIDTEMAAHGMSVVEIRRVEKQGDYQWETVLDSKYNRRLSALETNFAIAGPVAGSERLKTTASPGREIVGTVNNCSGGVTPWGTVLSGEENIQEYFGGGPTEPDAAHREADNFGRLGIDNHPRYLWYKTKPLFNLTEEPHAPNCFGWVVEMDPFTPDSQPIKRTALGRMRHEGAATIVCPDGRLVVYLGDDEANQHLYKFVSRDACTPDDPAKNADLLNHGVLYTATLTGDGVVEWKPLVFGQGPLTAENGFTSQADVLIETRRAAQLLGATPMDRPEDVEVEPSTGEVFVLLTNNRNREETNEANPRPHNSHGHILEMNVPEVAGGFDHAALKYTWTVLLCGGAPSDKVKAPGDEVDGDYPGWYQGAEPAGWLSCPDNCTFDHNGRIWIATDGADKAAGFADGLYACDTHGPHKGQPRLFFTAPIGSEVCGPCFTPDGSTLFLAVQHPGEGSVFDNPTTHWPAGLPGGDVKPGPPKPAVIAIMVDQRDTPA